MEILTVNIVGDRLKQLREQRGWSKTFVAKRLGYSAASTYANWEYGYRNPDTESLSKLADIYDCTTDYLLGRSDSRNLTKEDEEFREKHNLDGGVKEVMFRDMQEQLKEYSEEEVEELLEWMKFKAKQNRKKREKQQGE